MNILSFDTEEWSIEKTIHGGRDFKYKQFDETFFRLLDRLDELCLKGTFFCLGSLAVDFPDVVREIAKRGHEVGCHSHNHVWLTKLSPVEFRKDTSDAISALEDLVGQKVVSYRAPAFTIGESNKWAIEILAECGIENDASIFPVKRDFGGFSGFGLDRPCVVSYQGASLREFPICIGRIYGKQMAFSGGGYFRVLPSSILKSQLNKRDYTIWYFHLNDLISEQRKMMSRQQHENYYKEPGTLKNRYVRYLKNVIGSAGAFDKLSKFLECAPFINVHDAVNMIDWNDVSRIDL